MMSIVKAAVLVLAIASVGLTGFALGQTWAYLDCFDRHHVGPARFVAFR